MKIIFYNESLKDSLTNFFTNLKEEDRPLYADYESLKRICFPRNTTKSAFLYLTQIAAVLLNLTVFVPYNDETKPVAAEVKNYVIEVNPNLEVKFFNIDEEENSIQVDEISEDNVVTKIRTIIYIPSKETSDSAAAALNEDREIDFNSHKFFEDNINEDCKINIIIPNITEAINGSYDRIKSSIDIDTIIYEEEGEKSAIYQAIPIYCKTLAGEDITHIIKERKYIEIKEVEEDKEEAKEEVKEEDIEIIE